MPDAASTTCLRAPWVLPIAGPPLRDGWVTVARGRVVALGTGRPPDGPGVETRDLGHAVLLPGLINAHTHLELSWLWGKVPPAPSLPAWVSNLMGQRFARGADDRGADAPGDHRRARSGHRRRRRRRQHRRPARRRWRRAGCTASCSARSSASIRPIPAALDRGRGGGRRGAPLAARRRSRRPARALLGGARRAAPARRARGGAAGRRLQHPRRRVAGRDRVPADRRRPLARRARRPRRLESALDAAGVRPGRVPRSARRASGRRCSRCTASSAPTPNWRGSPRRGRPS